MFIRFATSEFSGSMMTRYPDQSSDRFVVPQITQFSPSTTRWQSRQTFPCFFLFIGGMLFPLTLGLFRFLFRGPGSSGSCPLFLFFDLFFEPERGAKACLSHGKADLTIPWFTLVQRECYYTDPYGVANADKAFGILA